MTCIFCSQDIPVLHETDLWRVIIDINPVVAGHVTAVPLRHVESIFDLNPNEWLQLQYLLNHLPKILQDTNFAERYQALKGVYGTDSDERLEKAITQSSTLGDVLGFNIGVNEGVSAGRTVDHVHVHVIPRYENDGGAGRGGIRNIFPEADYTQ